MTVSLIAAALFSLVTVHSVQAQGDAAAAVGGQKDNPRKPWEQWQPKPMYNLSELPIQYMGSNRIPGGGEPQSGWNQCAKDSWNQKSLCQTAWINSVDDWCVWGPPDGGEVGATERVAVAYCTTKKHGTRLIPDGTITGAHFLKTPSYVQISGIGDFTTIGIPAGDDGGEMDYAGADDLGNPIGGIIFTTAIPGTNGKATQLQYWTNFMSDKQFCLRGCWGENGAAHCEHKLDTMGCNFNMPSYTGYDPGFDTCEGEDAPFVGIYGASTFHQGDAITPEAHTPAASSNCITTASISNGGLLTAPRNDTTPSGTSPNGTAPAPAPTSPPAHPQTHRPSSSSGSGGSSSSSSSSSSSGAAGLVPLAAVFCFTLFAFLGVLSAAV